MGKHLYIIAGCNGAGKTTATFTILPNMIHCAEFVNADEIAQGISPFHPEKVAFESGRIMLQRIQDLLQQRENFAFETTLATKSYQKLIKSAQQQGYFVTLLFFCLQSTELAKERVKIRVSEGGHAIEPAVIERRYQAGLKNLFNIYLPIVDSAFIFDNSEGIPKLLAEKQMEIPLKIWEEKTFNLLKMTYENT
jgi:predicted ABC-type ATPase